MKKSDYLKAMTALTKESELMAAETELDKQTALYLSDRTQDLMQRMEQPALSKEKQEVLKKELLSLYGKFTYEQRKLDISDEKGKDFVNRLKALQLLEKAGLIEG